ncbi:serine/threonine-protein kinase 40-like [Homalodisca vitripennis]|uniref:serine/threonine-protein kinase 40-like n=1 Tax=Homalodisca vitripennis TaxID=197043 RepID=UPI001EE9BA6E|nr:serine/threonine-protein kinase 40-like [Homalodisca vitripennis]
MEPSGRKLVCRRRVAMFQANPSENDQPSQETDGPSTSSSDSSQQVPSDSDVVPPSSCNQRNFSVPPEGTPVPTNIVKRAGPFLLGPTLGNSPVKSIVQCLARQEGTDDFYTLKILTLKGDGEVETQDERQGKMLLHTEYSLLSLLSNQEDVVHHHGFFKVNLE